MAADVETRRYLLERVGDIGVIQLYADGFDQLSLRDKTLCYHLANAAVAGRDIFIDQKFGHSLAIRDLLEELYLHRDVLGPDIAAVIEEYTKLFWLNNGIHDHLSAEKNPLPLTLEQFQKALVRASQDGARLPSAHDVSEFYSILTAPDLFRKCTDKSPENGGDPLEASCNNLYRNVTMVEADSLGSQERHPLNSRLVKVTGELVEQVYRAGDPSRNIPKGLYADELTAVIEHLLLAAAIAPEETRKALELLVRYYRTGDPADWRAYNIAWVEDKANTVDTINGFVEVYLDARGMKGAWEAVVSFVNPEHSVEIKKLAAEAQWFEDRMPWDARFRKEEVTGLTANAITVVMETGDSGPMSPIGINLPNEADIRQNHGSKSVNLANVVAAYEAVGGSTSLDAFALSPAEKDRAERFGSLVNDVHTNLHEVIGHASGRVLPHVVNPAQLLGTFYSTLEEGRADLVALYWIADPKLQELGVIPHPDAALAKYEAYARNVLVQLRRVKPGGRLEEDHMRNRQMIVHWLIANTDAIAVEKQDGKTYYRVTSAEEFRRGCGELLAEVMRIKAEGDFKAGKQLVQTHGTSVDPELHREVLGRLTGMTRGSGFVQPELRAVRDPSGVIRDVKVHYPMSLEDQMLRFSGRRK